MRVRAIEAAGRRPPSRSVPTNSHHTTTVRPTSHPTHTPPQQHSGITQRHHVILHAPHTFPATPRPPRRFLQQLISLRPHFAPRAARTAARPDSPRPRHQPHPAQPASSAPASHPHARPFSAPPPPPHTQAYGKHTSNKHTRTMAAAAEDGISFWDMEEVGLRRWVEANPVL